MKSLQTQDVLLNTFGVVASTVTAVNSFNVNVNNHNSLFQVCVVVVIRNMSQGGRPPALKSARKPDIVNSLAFYIHNSTVQTQTYSFRYSIHTAFISKCSARQIYYI
jgi:hypothetical protein